MKARTTAVFAAVGLICGFVLRGAWVPEAALQNGPESRLVRDGPTLSRPEPGARDAKRAVTPAGTAAPAHGQAARTPDDPPTPPASEDYWLVDDGDACAGARDAAIREVRARICNDVRKVLEEHDAADMYEREYAAWPVLPLGVTETELDEAARRNLPHESDLRVLSRMQRLTPKAGTEAGKLLAGRFQVLAYRYGDAFHSICGRETGLLPGGADYGVDAVAALIGGISSVSRLPSETRARLRDLAHETQLEQARVRRELYDAMQDAISTGVATDLAAAPVVAVASVSGTPVVYRRGDLPELDELVDRLEARRRDLRARLDEVLR